MANKEEKKPFTPISGMHHSGARLPMEVFPDAETITVVVPKEFLMNVDAEHSKASAGIYNCVSLLALRKCPHS